MKYTISIKKSGTFKYLINNGSFSGGKYLVVYIIKNNKSINDLGICISKKNGIAVHRNKMKRWVREVYKQLELNIKKGITMVVLYKKNTLLADISYYDIEQDLIKCLKKQGVLNV